jgi:hypothetical protein
MLNAAAAVARGLKVPLLKGTYGCAAADLEDDGPNDRDNPACAARRSTRPYLVWRGGSQPFRSGYQHHCAFNTLITGVASTAGVQVGMLLTGAGIRRESMSRR